MVATRVATLKFIDYNVAMTFILIIIIIIIIIMVRVLTGYLNKRSK